MVARGVLCCQYTVLELGNVGMSFIWHLGAMSGCHCLAGEYRDPHS